MAARSSPPAPPLAALLLPLLPLLLATAGTAGTARGRWLDSRLPPDARASALLGAMTLSEKAAMLHGHPSDQNCSEGSAISPQTCVSLLAQSVYLPCGLQLRISVTRLGCVNSFCVMRRGSVRRLYPSQYAARHSRAAAAGRAERRCRSCQQSDQVARRLAPGGDV
jgi:hypothetical protein